MNPIQGSPRNLPYPLNRSVGFNGAIDDEFATLPTLDGWPSADNNERVEIVLNVSLNEYIALASAVDAGRDIAYGEDSNVIWDIWSQSIVSVDFCQSVADCINDPTSPAYDAVVNVSQQNAADGKRDYAQEKNLDNLAEGSNPLCDNDILFGQCLQLVDYMDTLNREAFARFEAETNPLEAVADIIGDITLIDETSIDAILAWIEFVLDNLADNYDANSTVAYREALACEIFCVARDNGCAVTPTILYDIMDARVGAALSIENLLPTTLLYVVSGTWIGSQIVDIVFFSQVGFRGQLGQWFQRIAWNDIEQRLLIYANDPNPDWVFLCDCPGEPWEEVFDFQVNDGGFVPSTVSGLTRASYTATGWARGSANNQCVILKQLLSDGNITEVEVTIGTAEAGAVTIQEYSAPNGFVQNLGSEPMGGVTIVTGDWNILSGNYLGVNCTASDGQFLTRITSMTVRGTGVNPFV